MRRLALLLLLAGCHRGEAPAATPQDAYRNFIEAMAAAHQSGDPKGLIDFFDAPTRAALAARSTAAAQKLGDPAPADPGWQLLEGASLAPPVADLAVQAQTPTTATLTISGDGGALGTVKLVLEQGRWRIHLDALPGS